MYISACVKETRFRALATPVSTARLAAAVGNHLSTEGISARRIVSSSRTAEAISAGLAERVEEDSGIWKMPRMLFASDEYCSSASISPVKRLAYFPSWRSVDSMVSLPSAAEKRETDRFSEAASEALSVKEAGTATVYTGSRNMHRAASAETAAARRNRRLTASLASASFSAFRSPISR